MASKRRSQPDVKFRPASTESPLSEEMSKIFGPLMAGRAEAYVAQARERFHSCPCSACVYLREKFRGL